MADSWMPICNKGRDRAPFNKGGRGPPRGGRSAVDPMVAKAVTREGTPIASRLSISLDSNSTTDDALALFSQVKHKHPAHHSITVSPEHVIQLLRRPHTPKTTLSTPNCYSHNMHDRSPLRGTAALIKISHLALGHNKTNLINYYYSHGCFPHYNAMLRTI